MDIISKVGAVECVTCADQTWSKYLPDIIMVYIMYWIIVVIIPPLLCDSLAHRQWRYGSSEESRDVQLALHPTSVSRVDCLCI